MVHFHRATRFNYILALGALFSAMVWIIACMTIVHAEDAPKVPCPTPGQSCKVIILSPQEENLLTGQNGILDTAAQGRQIDLGGFAVYFKSKIASAPAGETKPAEKPAVEGNPALGAGPSNPASK